MTWKGECAAPTWAGRDVPAQMYASCVQEEERQRQAKKVRDKYLRQEEAKFQAEMGTKAKEERLDGCGHDC